VTCLAAALPDAVTGAALAGASSGPLLVIAGDTLNPGAAAFLADDGLGATTAYVLGGPRSVANGILAELGGAPGLTNITSVAKMVAKKARLVARVGVNTSEVKLYASGKLVTTKAVKPFSTVDFGYVWLPTGATQLRIVATNPDGLTATANRTVKRLTYPASTSIVIDKSDFRLYWVKNDVLVKAYPIAHGKPGHSTPETSWKILAKYISSGVYGPRKMRLFKKTGSGYARTAYLVHGTNQEWVIGTRASHGCIRMYNKDVLELYPQVKIGTKVVTRS
jgi:lipoprotein-anchoring transpeptidase ErfK/SrfK